MAWQNYAIDKIILTIIIASIAFYILWPLLGLNSSITHFIIFLLIVTAIAIWYYNPEKTKEKNKNEKKVT